MDVYEASNNSPRWSESKTRNVSYGIGEDV